MPGIGVAKGAGAIGRATWVGDEVVKNFDCPAAATITMYSSPIKATG